MKEEPVIFQFEDAHATVIFKNEKSAATGRKHARLYVQAIDQYGYQREWTLEFRHESGNSRVTYWESHIYMHPGRRQIVKVGAKMAENCIRHFLHVCRKYPNLLFNAAALVNHDPARPLPARLEIRPRNQGFVNLAEALHRGALPSARLF